MKHPIKTPLRILIWSLILVSLALVLWLANLNDTWVPLQLPGVSHRLLGRKEYDLWLPALLLLSWASMLLTLMLCRFGLLAFIHKRRRNTWAAQLDEELDPPV